MLCSRGCQRQRIAANTYELDPPVVNLIEVPIPAEVKILAPERSFVFRIVVLYVPPPPLERSVWQLPIAYTMCSLNYI